jgi:tetratricopeptide (TPR) repeat protein
MSATSKVESIMRIWPSEGAAPSNRLLRLMERAVGLHPCSARLWCLRGDLYQLQFAHPSREFDPRIPLRYYKKALVLNNRLADAHNEIGYLYDVYFEEYAQAECAFRAAISLGGDHTSYYGLARVLAEMGRSDEALSSLSPAQCPYINHPDINVVRTEIASQLWSPCLGNPKRRRK